jgi:tRNA(Ile)-lysidine synthase
MTPRRKPNWRKVAEAIAATISKQRLDPAVRRWVDNGSARTRWCVALSGGADSVALLLLLWAHWPERRRHLCALHFDHRLRGSAAARADEKFCRGLCAALGIKLRLGHWRRPRGATRPSEAEARVERMAFFERYSAILWLGHHQDDVAETMLMRLARGSGSGGLAAPRPVQTMPADRLHLRPLLGIQKAELITALRDAGATWREDRTNSGRAYFRNRVRGDVIPVWVAAAGRDAVAGAARSRELLAEDDAALEAITNRISPIGAAGEMLLSRLVGQPRAVVRRALHQWLGRQKPQVDVSRQAFDALLDAVCLAKPTRHSLGWEAFAVLRKGRLYYEARKAPSKFHRRVN